MLLTKTPRPLDKWSDSGMYRNWQKHLRPLDKWSDSGMYRRLTKTPQNTRQLQWQWHVQGTDNDTSDHLANEVTVVYAPCTYHCRFNCLEVWVSLFVSCTYHCHFICLEVWVSLLVTCIYHCHFICQVVRGVVVSPLYMPLPLQLSSVLGGFCRTCY
jgi:hypothetical protein